MKIRNLREPDPAHEKEMAGMMNILRHAVTALHMTRDALEAHASKGPVTSRAMDYASEVIDATHDLLALKDPSHE